MTYNKNFEGILCPSCNKKKFIEQNLFYKDRKENPLGIKYLEGKYKIYTCKSCEIGFCNKISKKKLEEYYKSIYIKKDQNKNRFKEFNSRFFSQVLFFINHEKLKNKIKVLEVGPNSQGILPTLKIFQKNIIYYYFEQFELAINDENIIKLGDYFDPNDVALPNVDLIWMSHSLEHIHPADLNKIIKSYYNALNPGGSIFVEIPDDFKSKTFHFPHTLFFSKNSLCKFFEKNNFDIIAASKINSNYSEKLNNKKKNHNKINRRLIYKIYLLIQNYLPDKFVKKFVFKNFVNNGPSTNLPIIRIVAKKTN